MKRVLGILSNFKKNIHAGWLWKSYFRYKAWRYNSRLNEKRVHVPHEFQPLPHSYAGHHGPWIENCFFGYWCKNESSLNKCDDIHRVYLPIFWTDYYIKNRLSYGNPSAKIQKFLDNRLDPGKEYFTIVQADLGCQESLPKNVLVFGCGVGNIPIPLLKGNQQVVDGGDRDILCSFMGNLEGASNTGGIRKRMFEALVDKKGFYFSQGGLNKFKAITRRSKFSLCPRGLSRTSFRLYEVMALGAIPLYIWDDREWLPYQDELDWNEFSVRVNIKEIQYLPDILYSLDSERILSMKNKIKDLFSEYFTLEGVSRRIVEKLRCV